MNVFHRLASLRLAPDGEPRPDAPFGQGPFAARVLRGTIVGATIVASRAGELSGEISLAVAHRLRVGDIATSVHAYPTYATALQQMTSQAATARWTSSVAGRFIGRLLGFPAGPDRGTR